MWHDLDEPIRDHCKALNCLISSWNLITLFSRRKKGKGDKFSALVDFWIAKLVG